MNIPIVQRTLAYIDSFSWKETGAYLESWLGWIDNYSTFDSYFMLILFFSGIIMMMNVVGIFDED